MAHGRRGGTFFGWWVVLGTLAVTFVGAGIGFYCMGVFLDPLVKTHGWSKSEVSYAITLFFLTGGVLGVVVGRAVDTRGPRPVLLLGAAVMAASLFVLGHISALWQLYAVYAVMAVGYSCLSSITVSAVVARWFITRRARALSLTMTGTSLGGMLLVPLTTTVIADRGFAVATAGLALLSLCLVVPVAMLVIRHDPAEMELLPDGATAEVECGGAAARETVLPASQTRVWTRTEAMHTRAFWMITVAFALVLVGQTAYLVHQLSFLRTVIGTDKAALAVSATAGGSIAGRLFLGSFADRLDKRMLSIGCVLLQSASLVLIARSSSTILLYAGTLGIGLTMGNIYMMQSLLVGECFGLASFGTVFGLVSVLAQIGSAVGPTIAGTLFDATGSYRLSFIILSTGGLIAAALIVFARPASHHEALPVASPVLLHVPKRS